jgi:hypothetical protein
MDDLMLLTLLRAGGIGPLYAFRPDVNVVFDADPLDVLSDSTGAFAHVLGQSTCINLSLCQSA